ncbi:MAG: hypothetical protein EB078_01300 [Proteobacteria bacterium]|nr:hypothetical protein [Pseudomonadota bacterium]NDC24286.1 hypothetical protein [Pseudomonadota bacterium]NDD03515.1 hypothetical protein [Pseudomonadota bacterium]NDG27583.1 hypothetical protein [Pseudomonadota bacterium]
MIFWRGILTLSCLFSLNLWSTENSRRPASFVYPERASTLTVFDVGGGLFFGQNGERPGNFVVHWTPMVSLGNLNWLKFYLGAINQKIFSDQSFTIGDFALTLVERSSGAKQITGELGAGAQFWNGRGSANWLPLARAAIGYNFDNSSNFLRGVQLVYSAVIDQRVLNHQIYSAFTLGF